jgi:hypothetical protein
MSSDYYVWSVDRKPIEIRLNLTVVDRVQALASWAFHNAGKEIHGILLGRIERRGKRRTVYIEELDLFDPASGPPRARHRPWLDCVGLFRSHIREAMRLDHIDASLISNYFSNTGMVYLLVKPADSAPSTGAFFIQEDGRVRGYASYLEFPFHADILRTRGFRVVSESEPAPVSRWKWIAGMAAVLIALLAGWWWWPRPNAAASDTAQTAPAPVAPAPVSLPAPDTSSPAAAPLSASPVPAPPAIQSPDAPADAVGAADRSAKHKPERKTKRSRRTRARAASR